jgi:hypothetical protein
MWPSARIILRLALSVTSYDAVLKASAESIHIKPLIKQLTDLRKMALSVVSPTLEYKMNLRLAHYQRALDPISVR